MEAAVDRANDRTAPGQGSVPVDAPPTTDTPMTNDPAAPQAEEGLRFPDAETMQGQPADDDPDPEDTAETGPNQSADDASD
jgi:hypothetical protein